MINNLYKKDNTMLHKLFSILNKTAKEECKNDKFETLNREIVNIDIGLFNDVSDYKKDNFWDDDCYKFNVKITSADKFILMDLFNKYKKFILESYYHILYKKYELINSIHGRYFKEYKFLEEFYKLLEYDNFKYLQQMRSKDQDDVAVLVNNLVVEFIVNDCANNGFTLLDENSSSDIITEYQNYYGIYSKYSESNKMDVLYSLLHYSYFYVNKLNDRLKPINIFVFYKLMEDDNEMNEVLTLHNISIDDEFKKDWNKLIKFRLTQIKTYDKMVENGYTFQI